MWKESCFARWRILLARDAINRQYIEKRGRTVTFRRLVKQAEQMVENNQDPVAECLGSRLSAGKDYILALFDQAIRNMCPHAQIVQRDAAMLEWATNATRHAWRC